MAWGEVMMNKVECFRKDMENIEFDKPTLFRAITSQCPSQILEGLQGDNECENDCEACWDKALNRKIEW